MIFQGKAKVTKNIKVIKSYHKITISCSSIAKRSNPGQFIEVKVSDNYEPFLRRPFSIHRVAAGIIEILYEVVGLGTEILSQKKPGEYLDMIGPLGNGFDYRSPGHQVTRSPVLVAGGMGVAPLIFLAEKLAEIKNPCLSGRQEKSKIKNLILIGGRTKNDILCEKEFKRLGFDVKIATDDGSAGFKGKVTDLLLDLLTTNYSLLSTIIYACGPRPMLQEIAALSKRYNIPAQISLEEHMACGIGACLGCVVKTQYSIRNTQYEYKRVCKEGPVFEAEEIVW